MFRKLISNLPFAPQLINQISFYGKRLRQENATRRLVVVFATLAFIVQATAFALPTKSSTAASVNDIVYGGVSSDPTRQLLQIWDCDCDSYGHTGFRALFSYFGISRQAIAEAGLGSINSADHQLNSLGRVHHFAQDQPIGVGGQTYYLRPLYLWGDNSTYRALKGVRDNGKPFAIMLDCGNIVVETAPTPGSPQLNLQKTTLPGTPAADAEVAPGTTLGYRISFQNIGAGAANEVIIEDSIPAHTSFVWQGAGGATSYSEVTAPYPGHPSEPHLVWSYQEMPGGASGYYVDFTVKVDADTPDGTRICNTAFIRSNQTPQEDSKPAVCHIVRVNAPPPPPPPPHTPPPTINTKLTQSKQAVNLRRPGRNANGTTARAGDTIQYTLNTNNNGTDTVKDYVLKEQVADVLEYAKIIDYGGAELKDGYLVWPASDIKPKATLIRTFQVKVNSPISRRSHSTSDPQSFDLRMDNVYGNQIQIHLSAPSVKKVERLTGKLPATGPNRGTLLMAGFLILVAYFYLRNRQLINEISLLRKTYNQGGHL